MPTWPFALLAGLIVCRAIIYMAAVLGGDWESRAGSLHPTWAQLALGSLYGVCAVTLMVLGRRDPRAWGLGAFLGGFACALMDSFLRGENPLLEAARGIRTDAFFSASLWFFCATFPSPSRRPWVATALAGGVVVTSLLGIALVLLDAIDTFALAAPVALAEIALQVARYAPGTRDWYFTLQFLSMLPLLVLMRQKTAEAGPDERRRIRWLTMGIVVSLGPLILDVFVTTWWPWVHEATRGTILWPLRSAVIMVSLTVLPLATTYSTLVHRTVDIGFVLRAAAQYLLARYAVHGLVAVPVVAAIAVMVANRDRSLMEMATSGAGVSLAIMSLLAAIGLSGRKRILHAVDVRFFREAVDAQSTLLSLVAEVRTAESIEVLADRAQCALQAAFHPHTIAICIADSSGNFVPQNLDAPSLATASALSQILATSDHPLIVDTIPSVMRARLPSGDREWLEALAPYALLPMRVATGELGGVIAIGERRSQLPYTTADLRLLMALGTACGLGIERWRGARTASASDAAVTHYARECVECGEVLDNDVIACSCGAPLQRAGVPKVLNDRFRIERRVGAGGYGVVYAAVDLQLRHPRAIKALPLSDPAHFSRLRREARLMSAVQHPNLAIVFALETWGMSPLLVMEFLDGGTLADRLKRGPLSEGDVGALGLQLGSALRSLHGSGVLHRDIKPSNIGFTGDGTPKLLDFGLAKMSDVHARLKPSSPSESTWTVLGESERSNGFHGTPAYASPDLLLGSKPSPADDVWSLAVTLLEAATGANPFKAETPAAVAARVLTGDSILEQWLHSVSPRQREPFSRLLVRDRGRRAATSVELLEMFREMHVNPALQSPERRA